MSMTLYGNGELLIDLMEEEPPILQDDDPDWHEITQLVSELTEV